MNRPAPYEIWLATARAFAGDKKHFKVLHLMYFKSLELTEKEERKVSAFMRGLARQDRMIEKKFAALAKAQEDRERYLRRCPHPENWRTPRPSVDLNSTKGRQIVARCNLCGL